MTRWYDKQQTCEQCGELFESNRYDARFCSPKCRTAHHRREKRRAQAAESMAAAWDAPTRSAYAHLVDELPAIADGIKDIFTDHSPEAAAAAARVAFDVFTVTTQRMEIRLQHKERTIETLRSEQETLQAIRRLLR